MTGITAEGFEIHREFAAPPAAVFAALTTAEHFARWWGGAAVEVPLDRLDFEPVVGGTWSAVMVLPDGNTIDWAGTFLEITPDTRFVLTITDRPHEPEQAPVTFELSPTERGTLLHMTQVSPGFTAEQREATIAGWQTFLDVVAEIAEA
ncbi:SRPBCC family protein [Protaetiibacter larvae]|uniref:SRPBCC domain-containing protein n=1 Tax=Protaetiibacter larvae TaxID=2592654 RepID=A0A5C1Y4W8_9MICO|nr:SRPBCC domain-containing protein [Protaetiibacter larvae]QEO09083.1 SRPBCC domain-containing protein [Protaetiibacter larvae]